MDVGNQRRGSCKEGPAKGEVLATLAAERPDPPARRQHKIQPLLLMVMLGGAVDKDVDACRDKASDRSSFFRERRTPARKQA